MPAKAGISPYVAGDSSLRWNDEDLAIYQNEGVHFFFIDEIHKYPNWDQELKNIYDGFPKIKMVFSGSSSLELVKGSYDLSRRAKLYTLQGFS